LSTTTLEAINHDDKNVAKVDLPKVDAPKVDVPGVGEGN
jgi:hypothetical protein